MKVLHVATDIHSGAGRGAFELHKQLVSLSVDSKYLATIDSVPGQTLELTRKDKLLAKVLPRVERILAKSNGAANSRILFSLSPSWLHADLMPYIEKLQPDVVHLHWVAKGTVSPAYAKQISKKWPTVWTLRDMNMLTGGCHYPGSCQRWHDKCGRCPAINSQDDGDISFRQQSDKIKELTNSNVTFIATSSLMQQLASASPLAHLVYPESIPISIDLRNFRIRDRNACRIALGLPLDRKYVFYSGLHFQKDPRKGWSFMQRLWQASRESRNWSLLVAGDDTFTSADPNIHSFGRLFDAVSIGLLYSAADLSIMPSEEESFGKVVAESLASGRPVIAGSAVGAAEFIEHGKTGFVFENYDVEPVLSAIDQLISLTPQQEQELAMRCAVSAQEFFGLKGAESHLQMYSWSQSRFRKR